MNWFLRTDKMRESGFLKLTFLYYIHLTVFPPLIPRHEEEFRISPAFEVGEFIQLFLSLYKPRSLAIENKSTFFEMIKFFWRTKKRRYIPFQNY
jgi:hypothetical protein